MEREEGKVDRGVGEPRVLRGREGTRREAEYTETPWKGVSSVYPTTTRTPDTWGLRQRRVCSRHTSSSCPESWISLKEKDNTPFLQTQSGTPGPSLQD